MRRVALVTIVASLVAACASGPTPRRSNDASPSRSSSTSSAAPSPSASSSSSRGGYYLDDGPGDNPPPNLELLPDAVPRVEKYASGANRPYNVFGVDYVPDLSGKPYKERGTGSWYGRKFHGQRTSSGEIYDMYAMTAAHPTLPIPCYALVTNLANGRSVIVRVNDRGPFLHNRIMDLSYAAALKVGYLSSGSGQIEVEMLMPADVAAGRIPQTTTSLLLASGATPRAPVPPPSVAITTSSSPVAASSTLTIEALTANEPRPATGLPPAPTLTADAASRSLPLSSPPPSTSTVEPNEPIALPDSQPAPKLPETATRQGFYLQLGAFRAKPGADSFASHLSRLIDPQLASLVQVSEANGFYRVRVGPYAERVDADRAAASVRNAIAQPVLVMPDTIAR